MITSKVGLEAEFLVLDKDKNVVMPPTHFPHDGFPLLRVCDTSGM